MSAVNKVNFLLQAAATFPPNGYVNQLLKSHYLTTAREVAEKDLELPKKEFGETRMCQKCSSVWLDGSLKLRICPKKLKKSRQRKLAAKVDEDNDMMSRKQKRKAKWLKKNSKSRVEITCLLCKHKTKIHLDKPKKRNDSTTTISTTATTIKTITSQSTATSSQDNLNKSSTSSSSLNKKSSSKKKKKDKFAGLNPIVVAQASTSTSTSYNSSNISSCSSSIINSRGASSVKIIHPTPSTSKCIINQSQIGLDNNLAGSSASSSSNFIDNNNSRRSDMKILPISHNINKKAKKKNNNAQKKLLQAQIQPPKIVSKTQQKNTLLQLAQLLKTGASMSSKRTNHLENLLR